MKNMGQFYVEGATAKDLLQFVTSNNVENLENEKSAILLSSERKWRNCR